MDQQAEHFLSGTKIFEEGESGDRMYVVKEGEVDLSVRGKTIAVIGKGGILGEMAVIDNKPRSATALARTECDLVPIDQKRFLSLVQQNPGFAIEVMKVLVERLRLMDEGIETLHDGA